MAGIHIASISNCKIPSFLTSTPRQQFKKIVMSKDNYVFCIVLSQQKEVLHFHLLVLLPTLIVFH